MSDKDTFKVLNIDLSTRKCQVTFFGGRAEFIGGSGLAAALFKEYGLPEEAAAHPDQPLIFAIGPLTGYFPLMSKVVMGFKSPYHQQYAESHAGGRFALALKFASYDALVIKGVAEIPTCLIIGNRHMELRDVHYLRGQDAFTTGKYLRRTHGVGSGRRSIIRIGPAGEHRVPFASVNVDSYRHFGRLGGDAAMGAKNLKGMIILGDGNIDLPKGKDYTSLYKEVYGKTQTKVMRKYHDLGTPENLKVLNEKKSLPWRNLETTYSTDTEKISGEKFADKLLLRKMACAGCPVGCIHIGLLRELFATEHEFLYRQVSYDFEPIFAAGTMIGMTEPEAVLALLEEIDAQGLDAISTGVALAWATEALNKGVITEKETQVPLQFGDLDRYRQAVQKLGERANDFYTRLGQGAQSAAGYYGGEDFACVLGQEMAGYATGEVYFVSQAYGFRHSHLDSAGYSYDQKVGEKDPERAVNYLLEEEYRRVQLTCMVACLFARGVYTEDLLKEALGSIGMKHVADGLSKQTSAVQGMRWDLKFKTGYDPDRIIIPKRLREISTERGPLDESFMDELSRGYQKEVAKLLPGK